MAAMQTMLLAVLCLGVATAAPIPGSENRSPLADMLPMVQKLGENRLKALEMDHEIHRANMFKQIMALDIPAEEKMENAFKIGAINATVYEAFRENSGLATLDQAKQEGGEEASSKLTKFVDPSTGGVNLDGMSDAMAAQAAAAFRDSPIPQALKEQFAPQQFKELASATSNASESEAELAANSIALFTDANGKPDKPGQLPERWTNALKPDKTKPFGSTTANATQADQVNLFVDPALGAMLNDLPDMMKAAQKDFPAAMKQITTGKAANSSNASTDQVTLFVDPGPATKMVKDIPAALADAQKELPKLLSGSASSNKTNATEM